MGSWCLYFGSGVCVDSGWVCFALVGSRVRDSRALRDAADVCLSVLCSVVGRWFRRKNAYVEQCGARELPPSVSRERWGVAAQSNPPHYTAKQENSTTTSMFESFRDNKANGGDKQPITPFPLRHARALVYLQSPRHVKTSPATSAGASGQRRKCLRTKDAPSVDGGLAEGQHRVFRER